VNPAEIILNGSLLAAMPIALLAGLVTFLSPCVLPLVPGYLGYVSGAAQSKGRLVLGAILFVLGFTIVFVALGVLAGSAGLLFFANSFWVQFVLGLFVVIFGFAMLGQFSFLQRSFKIPFSPRVGLAGAPLLGVVFAVGWTPCIGPTLAAVLTLASTTGDPVRGGILATVYSLGIGIPFVLIALGMRWAVTSVAFVKQHLRTFNRFGGGLLILIGLLLMTGIWGQFLTWMQGVNGEFQLIL
jgi:cytochrome c-type biogenesis protein